MIKKRAKLKRTVLRILIRATIAIISRIVLHELGSTRKARDIKKIIYEVVPEMEVCEHEDSISSQGPKPLPVPAAQLDLKIPSGGFGQPADDPATEDPATEDAATEGPVAEDPPAGALADDPERA